MDFKGLEKWRKRWIKEVVGPPEWGASSRNDPFGVRRSTLLRLTSQTGHPDRRILTVGGLSSRRSWFFCLLPRYAHMESGMGTSSARTKPFDAYLCRVDLLLHRAPHQILTQTRLVWDWQSSSRSIGVLDWIQRVSTASLMGAPSF